jgi:hypothetical protein
MFSSGSTAVGSNALSKNDSYETGNTAVGYYALAENTESSGNTAVGYQALSMNTAANNTAVGTAALVANQTGADNSAFGYDALYYNETGNGNAAFGERALAYSNGNDNVAMGYRALIRNEIGNNNVGIGVRALEGYTTGHYNIGIGGDNPTAPSQYWTGSNNILLGYNVKASSAAADNELNIGNVLYGTNMYNSPNDVEAGINTPGKIGIGIATPITTLEVNGASSNTKSFNTTSTSIDFTKSNLAYSTVTTAAPVFNCTGMKDGATYTLAWQTTTAGTADITTNMAKTMFVGPRPAKTATQHAVYSIVCIGTTAYVYVTLFGI